VLKRCSPDLVGLNLRVLLHASPIGRQEDFGRVGVIGDRGQGLDGDDSTKFPLSRKYRHVIADDDCWSGVLAWLPLADT
jgi:hypothetical protein